jgi:hypothetical protein
MGDSFFDYTPVARNDQGNYNGLGQWCRRQWAAVPQAGPGLGAAFALRRAQFAAGVAAPPLNADLARGPDGWDLVAPEYVAAVFLSTSAYDDDAHARDAFTAGVAVQTGAHAALTDAELARLYEWVHKALKAPMAQRLPFLNEARRAQGAAARAFPQPWAMAFARTAVPANGPPAARQAFVPRVARAVRAGYVPCSRHLWADSRLLLPARQQILARWAKEALIQRLRAVLQAPAVAFADCKDLLALYLYVAAISTNAPFPNVWGAANYDFRTDPLHNGRAYEAVLIKEL